MDSRNLRESDFERFLPSYFTIMFQITQITDFNKWKKILVKSSYLLKRIM